MVNMNQQGRPPEDPGEARYQRHDLRARWLFVFLVVLVGFAIAAHWAVWELFDYLASRPREADAPQSVVSSPVVPGAGPMLQPTQRYDRLPAEDRALQLALEDGIFEKLGWRVDRSTHRAQMPDALIQQVLTQMQPDSGGQP